MDTELEKIHRNSEYKDIHSLISHFEERNNVILEVLQRNTVPSHLAGLKCEEAFLKIIGYSSLSNIMRLGYYQAIKSNDSSIYNNALFTFSRLNSERVKILDSGTDHCKLFPHVLDHIACGDLNTAAGFLDPTKGNSKKGHRFSKCTANLLQTILHAENISEESTLHEAKQFLQKKNSKFEVYTIEFLIALIEKNEQELNESLQNITKGYRSNKWLHDFKDPTLKLIGNFPIGLYKLARHYLQGNHVKIELPQHEVIWDQFALLTKKPKSFIEFQGKLSGLNLYLQSL